MSNKKEAKMSGGQVSYALFVQFIMCTYVCVTLCKTCKHCTCSKLVHVHVKPLATHLALVEFTLCSKINNACSTLQPEGRDVRLSGQLAVQTRYS